MNRQRKPASRLTIVFILAIVLSGSILAYFSINNISNQKELTEKKILEEERELSVRFSAALQNEIENITAGIEQETDRSASIREKLIEIATDREYIIQPFILDRHYRFIVPNFSGITETFPQPEFSERYSISFRKGEEAEFAGGDFRQAEKYYLSCLDHASGNEDSVKALNALGRIAKKLGNDEDALERYGQVVSDYYSVSDENGYPYVYYALLQLLRIPGTDHSEKLANLTGFFLEQMNSGLIPLNYFTEELLSVIKEWIKESDSISPEQLSHINRSIESLHQKLQLVSIYGEELKKILENGESYSYYSTENNFRIIDSHSGDHHEFFLVDTDPDFPSGFLINRHILFDTLVKESLRKDFDFEYVIEFPEGYPLNNNQNLVHSSQLNPYFPAQLIRIRLEDEGLISDIVRRRSWIYGIASILLLVAMMLGVVLILRDMSREKRLACLRSDFVSNVTHELKTPLTSIRMYAESLMMNRIKSESGRQKYLSVVINESERLKRMINNILEFSKMEKARQEYHPVETSLSGILHSAIRDMNYWMEKDGFHVRTEIEEDIKVTVDPDRFYQVYTNLLSNAIKYSGDSRNIYIRLYRNSESVVTEFEDEGIGIPGDKQAQIFEEFYRIESQESGNIAGTGLGLTVAREIVKAHHGKIRVESEVGKGSKFSVILYRNKTDEERSDHRG
jgi:signal transduction histidine kinase/tetratricopeptide (TPR) repeat protein